MESVSLSEAVAIFEKAYDILVEHAGATWSAKYDFVSLETMVETFPSKEYRFWGSLGFGGKFWNNDSLYVSCYSEDRTPERDAVIKKVNRLLSELKYPGPGPYHD